MISSKELGPWESQSHSLWLTPKMLRNWWISTMEVPWMSNELRNLDMNPMGMYPSKYAEGSCEGSLEPTLRPLHPDWLSLLSHVMVANVCCYTWLYHLASPFFFCALYLSLVNSLLVCTLSSAFHVFAYSCPLWSPHGCFSMPLYWQVPHFLLDYPIGKPLDIPLHMTDCGPNWFPIKNWGCWPEIRNLTG